MYKFHLKPCEYSEERREGERATEDGTRERPRSPIINKALLCYIQDAH